MNREWEDSDDLELWIAEFIERRELDEKLTPEAFVEDHPDGGDRLLSALRQLDSVEQMFMPSPGALPAKIGPYRVLGEVGRGGMGQVLRVEHEKRPGTSLALKVLHPFAQGNPRSFERFEREGEALARLRHPGLVRVLRTGVVDHTPFIAMDLVDGTNLAEVISSARERARQLPERPRFPADLLELPGHGDGNERAARVVARIARAVAAAHREGVLHRDLKPRNVMLRADGQPVLIDFGLGRMEGTPTLTGSGDMIGTPHYMAPEQARGERMDQRADVFGLGVVLYELLTLTLPRQEEEPLAALNRARSEPLFSPRRIVPALPRALTTIVCRATTHVRKWRFANAEVFAADLEAYLEGASLMARGPGPREHLTNFWLRHRWSSTIGSLLLVMAVIVTFLALREDEDAAQRRFWEARHKAVSMWFSGDNAAAHAATQRLLAERPNDPNSRFLLALLEDRIPVPTDEPIVQVWVKAETDRRAGRYAEAMQGFHVAMNIHHSPLPLLMMGKAAMDGDNPERAEWAYSRATGYLMKTARLHQTLGVVYRRLEQPLDSAVALKTACELEPDNPDNWLLRYEAEYLSGARDSGKRCVERLLQLTQRQHVDAIAEFAKQRAAAGHVAEAEELLQVIHSEQGTP
ncbi:MAG: protein kinase [Planctomycetota bacterium]